MPKVTTMNEKDLAAVARTFRRKTGMTRGTWAMSQTSIFNAEESRQHGRGKHAVYFLDPK
jgi:hypothetical protein